MFWSKESPDKLIEKLKNRISELEIDVNTLKNRLKEQDSRMDFIESNFKTFRRKALKLDSKSEEDENDKYNNGLVPIDV